jgi:hypothetical protein
VKVNKVNPVTPLIGKFSDAWSYEDEKLISFSIFLRMGKIQKQLKVGIEGSGYRYTFDRIP